MTKRCTLRYLLGLCLLLISLPLEAAIDDDLVIDPSRTGSETTSNTVLAELESGPSFGVVVAYLGLFCGAGYFVWRYIKKGSLSPARPDGSNGIHITDTKSLGNRQYLVVVECDEQRMLVGVGQGFINHLCFLDGTRQLAEEDIVPLPEAELKEAMQSR